MKETINKRIFLTTIISICIFSGVIFASCEKATIKYGEFPNTVVENATVSEKYLPVANEMSEFTIKELTENISQIPRKSGEVEQIRNYIYNWGIQHNVSTTKDASGCIYYDVPATAGLEAYPKIILQAHMDMVQTATDKNYDMNKNPIQIVYDETDSTLHSKDFLTNIGADDAEGMAALMVLATNKNYSHGPLRMLFTYDEETTMEGAINVSTSVLDAECLVNVDSGPAGAACVSSAGVIKIKLTKNFEATVPTLNTQLDVLIDGLAGGHSGVDIHKDRLNANIMCAQILKKLSDEGIDYQIAKLDGGWAMNIISTACHFVLYVDSANLDRTQEIINNEFEAIRAGHEDDKDGHITMSTKGPKVQNALCTLDSKTLVELLLKIPHGLKEMNKNYPDMPAVSSNFGLLSLENGNLSLVDFARSDREHFNDEFLETFKQFKNDYSAEIEILSRYSAWELSSDTQILDLFKESYKQTSNVDAISYVTHGGLECSRFLEKNPNLKMLSIGMDVADEHMVTEKLYTKSIPAFYAALIYFLENAQAIVQN